MKQILIKVKQLPEMVLTVEYYPVGTKFFCKGWSSLQEVKDVVFTEQGKVVYMNLHNAPCNSEDCDFVIHQISK